jgi:hypothetical protein
MRTVLMRRGSMLLLLALMGVGVMIAGCPSSEEMVPPPDTLEPLDETQTLGDPIKIGGIFATHRTGFVARRARGETRDDAAGADQCRRRHRRRPDRDCDPRHQGRRDRDPGGNPSELIEKRERGGDRRPEPLRARPLAIIEDVQQAEIPLVACAAASKITDPVKEWVFSTPQSDADAVVNIYGYLNAEGISSIALMTASDGYRHQPAHSASGRRPTQA